MNKREACEWVHRHMIVDGMAFDELVAAFTALSGRAPTGTDRQEGLFRRCGELLMSSTGVPALHHPLAFTNARKRPVK
jgi:hypothetical protein